jgi:alpha,alpha-trehalose phosphorylase
MSDDRSTHHSLGHAPWQLVETAHEPARAAVHESLFALGNGRIGVRGSHEEGRAWPGTSQDAIYVNGFHDTEAIHYPENGYGLARTNQFIVRVPNGKALQWWIDDEAFDPSAGQIADYRRTFDLRAGTITREFVWTSPQGRRVAVRSSRLVCLERADVYALEYAICPLDRAARIVLESSLDGRPHGTDASDDPRTGSVLAAEALEWIALERSDERITLIHRTRRSGLTLASAILQQAEAPSGLKCEDCGPDDCPGLRWTADLPAGETLQLTKFCALASSLDHPADALIARTGTALEAARRDGYMVLCAEQRNALTRYWQDADVEIDGNDAIQQGLRFNLLQLLQSVGRDGRTNIAAKGVTGSGYDGHYFWDTEIYVLPVLLHIRPQIARRLLEFRHHTLPAARERARELNHPHGALFPWRTIAGEECSAYFPAGTAQFHINADIAYAIRSYWQVTGDDDFMLQHGAELVFETARIWIGLGHFDSVAADGGTKRRFCIHTVTGPDEYTALVDNNLYTNAMARMHLEFAVEVAEWLARSHTETLRRIEAQIDLAPIEPALWEQAAACMYLPYDRARGIHPQDDGFLAKPRWEARDIDPARRPLLLHYHSLVIYRHQVCKQPDVVLALLLLHERFDAADKRRDFDYYEPLTTHDSSLSRCVFGIVAAEVGYPDEAYRYFVDSARTDLDDLHGNTAHGVHTAAMAGTWQGIVLGFAGMRLKRGKPAFAPHLPAAWTRYAFKLRLRDAQLQVCVDRGGTSYQLVDGTALSLEHRGLALELSRETPLATFPAEPL